MSITKAKRQQQELKQIKKFLKDRRLLKAFNRSKKIKRKTRFRLEYDGEVLDLIAYKKGKKTIIANSFTLEKVGSTTRFKTNQIKAALQGSKKKDLIFNNKKFKDPKDGRIIKTKGTPLKLNIVKKIAYVNFTGTRRTTPLRKKEGVLVLNITFIGADGRRVTKEASSRRGLSVRQTNGRILTLNSNRDQAFKEAFSRASAQAGFSYVDYEVNFIHYEYFTPRTSRNITI